MIFCGQHYETPCSGAMIVNEGLDMKSIQRVASFFSLGILALFLTACANQMEPAKHALDEIYNIVMPTTADGTKYVPDQMAGVQRELGELQSSYDKKDYAAVLARAPAVLADAKTLATDASAKMAQRVKALDTEWDGLATSLPQWITSVDDRVAALSKAKRVPRDIDFAAAKSSLADATDGWGRAQAAKASGEVDRAIAIANDVKSKIEATAAALKMDLPATAR